MSQHCAVGYVNGAPQRDGFSVPHTHGGHGHGHAHGHAHAQHPHPHSHAHHNLPPHPPPGLHLSYSAPPYSSSVSISNPQQQQHSPSNLAAVGMAHPPPPSMPVHPMSAGGMMGAGAVLSPRANLPAVESKSKNGMKYSLDVLQQPMRARMCGFGDKDRRPITPPPCVRLFIRDSAGNLVDPDKVDCNYFVLLVDLISSQGEDVNLVRSSNNSSPAVSISAASMSPFPPVPEHQMYQVYTAPQAAEYHRRMGNVAEAAAIMRGNLNSTYAFAGMGPPPSVPPDPHNPHMSQQSPSPNQFTRNLIGSLAVNAFKLKDDKGEMGIWFVLQDLSVRTEGSFRLSMHFFDLGSGVTGSSGGGSTSSSISNNSGGGGGGGTIGGSVQQLLTGAPMLASNYSAPFDVYSAKKFPGVMESTSLSKAFAAQGIKIPVRKENGKLANADEYENDD